MSGCLHLKSKIQTRNPDRVAIGSKFAGPSETSFNCQTSMHIHLVIVQPERYVHSQCFLDTADYLGYWLQQQGLTVSMAKNRLRHDAVNIIFGAHLGTDPSWTGPGYCSFIFNLEQLGAGGATLPSAYENLLRTCRLIDYHPENVACYRPPGDWVPLVPFWNAPYLNPPPEITDLSKRPIDLIFFGSINDERKALLKRVEKAGWDVAVFDSPTYYEERDAFIRQAKAVINTSFYASARFEQVRAFNVLSQGTAFISYLQPGQRIQEDFYECVFWLDEQNFDDFFEKQFSSKSWYEQAARKYERWTHKNPTPAFSNLLKEVRKQWQEHVLAERPVSVPTRLAQSGSYFPDVTNLSPNELDQADLALDLCVRRRWPWEGISRWGQALSLRFGQIEHIFFQQDLENTNQWRALFGNSMELLKVSGTLVVEINAHCVELSPGNQSHLRFGHAALLEYTDNFWRAGLFTHRLVLIAQECLSPDKKPCQPAEAHLYRLVFEKIETSSRERTLARMCLPDFGKREQRLEAGTPFAAYPSESGRFNV